MIKIKGKYNTAICFCAELEEIAAAQIKAVCDQKVFADSKIRIMPDVHAGMGCTIGTTMTITDKVVPGMVGVDIGCGMETVQIEERKVDFAQLDQLIRQNIPSGRDIRRYRHVLADEVDFEALRSFRHLNIERAQRSIGTLGGGNHFIEVSQDESGTLYVVVHSGSRHIGNEVAKYYQNQGLHALSGNAQFQLDEAIARLKSEGRADEIQTTIEALKNAKNPLPVPKDLAYVEGRLFDDYIHDMKIIQHFAVLNRKAMMDVILAGMNLHVADEFTTIHNYIDTDSMILRKGAVSAKAGEKLLIPINMRDGSLICIGKGNEDWNCSAPHGAGRLMSRRAAFGAFTMDEYRTQMEGIYTTCINRKTLDEAPMAYKNIEEITEQITPTAEIIARIKPLYNFKASE